MVRRNQCSSLSQTVMHMLKQFVHKMLQFARKAPQLSQSFVSAVYALHACPYSPSVHQSSQTRNNKTSGATQPDPTTCIRYMFRVPHLDTFQFISCQVASGLVPRLLHASVRVAQGRPTRCRPDTSLSPYLCTATIHNERFMFHNIDI